MSSLWLNVSCIRMNNRSGIDILVMEKVNAQIQNHGNQNSKTGLLICEGCFFGSMLLVGAGMNVRGQYNYTTLDVPGGKNTQAIGISGTNIVGGYQGSGGDFFGF